jgi:hypothetical protein
MLIHRVCLLLFNSLILHLLRDHRQQVVSLGCYARGAIAR